MPFATGLRKSLRDRNSEFPAEFLRGDSLEEVLNRHLLTVEQLGGDDAFTCVLLLSPDGRHLSYGAAPTVPASYCQASESIEIGPHAGSCGAAAYFGRPVYSVDIENDPVWGESRHLALMHGFKSCWSTPIRNSCDAIIGTFAILHRKKGMPTQEEIEAIGLITDHVADAIMWSHEKHGVAKYETHQSRFPPLRLVCDNTAASGAEARLLVIARRLEAKAMALDHHAALSRSETRAEELRTASELSRKLAGEILRRLDHDGPKGAGR